MEQLSPLRTLLALVVFHVAACGNLGFKCDNQTDCVNGYVCQDHTCRDPGTAPNDAGTASATSGAPSSQEGSSSALSSSGPRPSSSSAAPGSSAFPSSSASGSSAAPSSSRASSSLMGTSSSSDMPDAGPCGAPCPGSTVCVAAPGEAVRCECPTGTVTCGNNVCAPAGGCCVPGDDTPCSTGLCVGVNDGGAFCVGNACLTPDTTSDALGCTVGAPGVACCSSGLGAVALTRTGCSPELSPQCMWFAKDGDGAFVLTGSAVFSDVAIGTSVRLTVPPWDGLTGGRLELVSTGAITLGLAGSIDVSGRGYGGGGGGGAEQYQDANALCAPGGGGEPGGAADGEPGVAPGSALACGGFDPTRVAGGGGGRGGGLGGQPGTVGHARGNGCQPSGTGVGGQGGGSFPGSGGVTVGAGNACPSHPLCDAIAGQPREDNPVGPTPTRAGDGTPGGYRATAANGDTTTAQELWMGSGGGGGAGGTSSTGWCCGGAQGGHGGVPGGSSEVGCVGGSGGGGGGAGGGIIILSAKTVSIEGNVSANGAGQASLGAGYGAGGGIVIKARQSLYVGTFGRITSLGGAGAGELGTNTNGGTVKLSAPDAPDVPLVRVLAGRVMTF